MVIASLMKFNLEDLGQLVTV